MQIIEFTRGTLRFAESIPEQAPADGFVWLYLPRHEFETQREVLQQAAKRLGGSALLELHCKDLASPSHPSHYDSTSIYDLVIFRRLTNSNETPHEEAEGAVGQTAPEAPGGPQRGSSPAALRRIGTRAVGFAVFDRLIISVHPDTCATAKTFIASYLADAVYSEGMSEAALATARSRLPGSAADLMMRMVNMMVDSYLDLRRDLTVQLEQWQSELLDPSSRFDNWNSLMTVRSQMHALEDLCEEQHDAMQEWLDTLREFPAPPNAAQLAHRDGLVARAVDILEHINRVRRHVRRLEQSAETVVQIHFGALSNRTNAIMRTLTSMTAIFLPLNLITGIFGMNFEVMPLLKNNFGFWLTISTMVCVGLSLVVVFWRKRYLARSARPG